MNRYQVRGREEPTSLSRPRYSFACPSKWISPSPAGHAYLFNRTVADASPATGANYRAALLLQIGEIGRVAVTVVRQTDFREAGGDAGSQISLDLLNVGDGAEQIVGRGHAVTWSIGRIAFKVARLALADATGLTIAVSSRTDKGGILRCGDDGDRAIVVLSIVGTTEEGPVACQVLRH